ncbi:MAG: hypothetical protein OXU23_12460 [Candidatus Poribacteria bacterium]|nr:hypothetical protein [Candidatus Poribacteria bacterium]MDE0467166.1 hypothetical protein [Candidatus Poribacteria bacterium]
MRYLVLQFSAIAVVCIMMVGCVPTNVEPEPPRAIITFDYSPPETMPGSANLTFAVVGAEIVGGKRGTPIPLFKTFASNMTKDFGEILTARGFSVKGPFQDFEIMTYTDKEGTDLILTAEVEFSSDTTQIRSSSIGRLNGSIIVTCHVNLVAYESLTRNRLWTKSIAITPITVELISRNVYPNGASLATLLVNENKFHNDVGRALEGQYTEVLNRIYGYIEPEVMSIVGEAAKKLRNQKITQ